MTSKKAPGPKKQTQHGPLRAGLYIRVSSEKQAEKVSPETQEHDERELCKRQGYLVAEVYPDIEKYRVNGRLVEPSGTRHDRPQLKRLLADIDAGKIDVIIAWREDRLYRGVNRAMLEISERVKAGAVKVELVKEIYDPAIAEVKAWAAGVELQAKRDRHLMGVMGRLAAGKIWGPNPPYGYDYDKETGRWVMNETEAQWVRLVWKWYGSGVSLREIQRRLIAGGVKQKGSRKAKHVWGASSIRNMFSRDEYYTGKVTTRWDGTDYTIEVPAIIDQPTYEAVKDRLARYQAYPAGNYKQYSIAAGQVFCQACGVHMGVVRTQARKGGKYHYYYRCYSLSHGTCAPGCTHNVELFKSDTEIWRKVWKAISNPDELEAKINERIAQLQAERADAQGDCDKIQAKLDEITLKRQQVIAWALAKIISQDDLQMQLTGLDWQAASLHKELSEAALLTGDRETKLRAIADNLRAKVEVGRELMALENPTPEQIQDIFNFKRTIIQGLVTWIKIDADKSITLKLELDDSPGTADQALLIGDMSSRYHLTDLQRFTITLTL